MHPHVDSDLYIDASHMVTDRRRISDTLMTAVMWVIYSYLWAPFVSLLAWLLGIEFAYDVMVRAGGAKGLVDVLIFYSIVLVCIIIVVTAWSAINRHRFAGRDRRQSVANVPDEQIAEHFSLSLEVFNKIRSARVSNVSISPGAMIEQVRAVDITKE
jgi:biofilm PGA synthesis protein PgaD